MLLRLSLIACLVATGAQAKILATTVPEEECSTCNARFKSKQKLQALRSKAKDSAPQPAATEAGGAQDE